MSERLFNSAYSAMVFAFNFAHQAYDPPVMNKLGWGPLNRISKGLSGTAGAAQSGLILSRLTRLTIPQQNVVVAKFAPHTWPCSCRAPCCAGKKPNGEWEQAICDLGTIASHDCLDGCSPNRALREGIIRKIFGDNALTLEQLAVRTGVSERTAKSHSILIKRWLCGEKHPKTGSEVGLIEITLSRAETLLEEAGLICEELPY